MKQSCTFRKSERLCSRRLIDQLFEPGQSKSIAAYPLRLVYQTAKENTALLISVPKRYFKHAVDRNRVKRQIREAYRTNKHILPEGMPLHLAILWLDSKHYPTATIEKKVRNILTRCAEAIGSNETTAPEATTGNETNQ